MRRLRMVEFFSGSGQMSDAFKRHGFDTLTVDFSRKLNPDLCFDMNLIAPEDVTERLGGRPDVVWASPDCTTFSVGAISRHRVKNKDTGVLEPKTDYARLSDMIDQRLIGCCLCSPPLWWIENPRGGMRTEPWMREPLKRYTVTYCQYGDTRQKPTDIWTNHPNPCFKPVCKPGAPCHEYSPRGSNGGTQGLNGSFERSKIPVGLCDHIAQVSRDYLLGLDEYDSGLLF